MSSPSSTRVPAPAHGPIRKPSALNDRIAQLIFPRIGSNMEPAVKVEEDVEHTRDLLARHAIGGLCLFNGDRYHTPQSLALLQAASRFPLLVATDMERGAGQQIRGATVFPHAMAYESQDPETVEAMARISAREALATGIHISFSPVADVASNPDNPIIATRAFGRSIETVIPRVEAYIHGCQAEGLLTTAKHFPGHGDTETDSHDGMPLVSRSAHSLEELEFPPFRAAVEAGAGLVMTAHVAYPALDPSGRIATQSRPILTDLLRGKLGFHGAVVSDSLLMAGAQSDHDPVKTLLAGVDILLDVNDIDSTVDALVAAAHADAEVRRRVDEAFGRVWALKEQFFNRFGAGFFQDPGTAFDMSLVGCDPHRQLAADHARGALVVREASEQFRFLASRPGRTSTLCVLVRPNTNYTDPTQSPLEAAFRRHYPDGDYVEILPDTSEEEMEDVRDRAAGYRCILLAVIVKPAAWHRYGLLPAQRVFVEDLSEEEQVVLASLGSPTVLDAFPNAAHAVCLFSDVEASQHALIEYIAGLEQ